MRQNGVSVASWFMVSDLQQWGKNSSRRRILSIPRPLEKHAPSHKVSTKCSNARLSHRWFNEFSRPVLRGLICSPMFSAMGGPICAWHGDQSLAFPECSISDTLFHFESGRLKWTWDRNWGQISNFLTHTNLGEGWANCPSQVFTAHAV